MPSTALSGACSAVSFDGAAIADYVTDRDNCLRVAPGDVEALAVSIRELAANPALRARLGEAARRRVDAQASPEAIAGRWRQVYAELGA